MCIWYNKNNMKKEINIKEALSFGWTKTKQHFWFVVGVTFVAFFITAALRAFLEHGYSRGFGALILKLGLMVLNIILSIGGLKIFLKLFNGESAEWNDLFAHYRLFWKFFLGQLLVGVITFAGLILLIVPGFVWAMKYLFVPLLVVDKHMKPLEALKESGRITYGYKWNLFLLSIVIGLLNVLGFIVLGVGVLVTMPISMFVYVFVYRKLLDAGSVVIVNS